MSALEDLIYGERGRLQNVPTSEAYKKLMDVVIECDEKMREMLASMPDLLEQYEKVLDAHDTAYMQSNADYMIEGLRFGILLGLDIAGCPEKPTPAI